MKKDELKVKIIGLEDEKSFNELLAKVQVDIVMKMCKSELRIKVLENTLKILKLN